MTKLQNALKNRGHWLSLNSKLPPKISLSVPFLVADFNSERVGGEQHWNFLLPLPLTVRKGKNEKLKVREFKTKMRVLALVAPWP